MTLAFIAPFWLLALLAVVLLAAAVQDAVSLRIANLLCLAILLLGMVAMALHGFTLPMWQNGAVFLLFLTLGTLAFAGQIMGGGDVKMLAALGLWFKLSDVLLLLIAVSIAGGLLALIMIIGRRVVAGVRGTKTSRGMLPYGVAIAAGAAFVMTNQVRDRWAIDAALHHAPTLTTAAILR